MSYFTGGGGIENPQSNNNFLEASYAEKKNNLNNLSFTKKLFYL
ncbi:hypothetical protein ACUVGL_001404 [Campylobacter lari]